MEYEICFDCNGKGCTECDYDGRLPIPEPDERNVACIGKNQQFKSVSDWENSLPEPPKGE